MEKIDKIKLKLTKLNENYDDLKPFMQDYLYRIEEFIENKEKVQNEAIKILKTSSYNVSDVSKELGCSRTTLYNHNQLLKKYIEISITLSEENNPYVAYEELKRSKQKLQEQVNLMENRDIDIEIQKHEKKVLNNKIIEQNKEIERLQTRVNELSSELHQLKKSFPKSDNKIISITNKTK